jgi:hypothetical protein
MSYIFENICRVLNTPKWVPNAAGRVRFVCGKLASVQDSNTNSNSIDSCDEKLFKKHPPAFFYMGIKSLPNYLEGEGGESSLYDHPHPHPSRNREKFLEKFL